MAEPDSGHPLFTRRPANAVFDAAGARFARLPMTPERLHEAIAAAKSRRSAAG